MPLRTESFSLGDLAAPRPLRAVLTAGLALLGVLAAKAEAKAEAPAAAPPIIVRAAHVFDGERMLDQRWLVIEQGVIKKVASEAPSVPGARVIDLGAATLTPGLIDVHAHILVADGVPLDRGRMTLLAESSAQKALRALRAAQRMLQAGFTTIRDPGDFDLARAHLDVRDAIEHGDFLGPTIFAADRFITRTGGHYDDNWVAPDQHIGPWARIADGPEEMVRAVRAEVKAGADWIKLAGSGGFTTPGSLPELPNFTDEELHAAVTEAHRLGRRVAVHAHPPAAVAAAVRAGVDSIEHGGGATPALLREMGKKGIYWVPTIYPSFLVREHKDWWNIWRNSPEFTEFKAQLGAALAAGVPIAFGTDSGIHPHGDGVRMLAQLVAAGMSPTQAIRCATVVSAKMLGLTDVGRIAEGQRADLIAVSGDPLKDVRAFESVSFVMRRGVVARNTP